MHVREILSKRHDELKASISAVEAEIKDIEAALKAMGPAASPSVEGSNTANRFQIRHSMPVNDAIILAIEAGRKTPVSILDYLKEELEINTTINSVRSRVSPLKADGKIAHDGHGWVPIKKNGSGSLI